MLIPEDIGRAISAARTAWDLTVDELALRSGLTPDVVTSAEAGDAAVADLSALASALGGNLDDLVSGVTFWEAPSVAFRNAPDEVEIPALRNALIKLSSAARELAHLRQLLSVGVPAHKFDPVAIDVNPAKQAELLAEKVRLALDNPSAPITSVRECMRRLGVGTFLARFGTETVDGMSWRDSEGNSFAAANAEAREGGLTAVRMTLAHELCHLLFDGTKGRALGVVDKRTDRGEAIEQRANAFAAHFLAPRVAVKRFLAERGLRHPEAPRSAHVLALSEHFLMGVEATAWHLVNCGYWDRDEVARHRHLKTRLAEGADNAELRPTPGESDVPIERRGELLELATLALEAGGISIGRFREVLRLDATSDWSRLLVERQVDRDVEHRTDM